MSPRHFTKATFGPYYMSGKHYNPNKKPHIHQTITCKVLKYTGIAYVIDLFKSQEK